MSPEANKPKSIAGKLCVQLATLFGIGTIPKCPGTAASLLTLPIAYILASKGWVFYLAVTSFVTILAVPICDRAAKLLGGGDPSCIVLDELSGMLISYAPLSYFSFDVHLSLMLAIPVFWFRIFDIWKPGVVGKVQTIKGGWGIVLDDVIAGIFAAIANIISFLGITRIFMSKY